MGRGDDNILFNDKLVRAPRDKKPSEEDLLLESKPGYPLLRMEREELLFPLIWETTEEIGEQRTLARLGGLNKKRSVCRKLAKTFAEEKEGVGQEVEDFYLAWEKEASESGLYRELMQAKNIDNRKDLIHIWASLFNSPARENRILYIDKNLPTLSEESKSALLDSLPRAHHLIVSGDESIKKNPEMGDWRLEEALLSYPFLKRT